MLDKKHATIEHFRALLDTGVDLHKMVHSVIAMLGFYAISIR